MDQAAKDIVNLGMGAVHTFQNMDRLKMQKEASAREKVRFDQAQEDRQLDKMAELQVAEDLKSSGLIDGGVINDKGLQVIANASEADDEQYIDFLSSKGPNAFRYAKAKAKLTGELLKIERNRENLAMLNFDRSIRKYKNVILPNIQMAEHELQSGNRGKAAVHIAEVIKNAEHRVTAEPEGDKIKVWTVIDGKPQKPDYYTPEEALKIGKEYTEQRYVTEGAAHVFAGYEMNKNPAVFNMIDPNGVKREVLQIQKPYGTRYIFFNPDRSVDKTAPKNLEIAMESGWREEKELTKEDYAKSKEERAAAEEKRKAEKHKKEPKKERLKYINDYVKDNITESVEGEVDPKEREALKEKAIIEYNKGYMNWTIAGRVQSTGEILWNDENGKLVNSYGIPVIVTGEKTEKKKKVSKEIQDWRNKIKVNQ